MKSLATFSFFALSLLFGSNPVLAHNAAHNAPHVHETCLTAWCSEKTPHVPTYTHTTKQTQTETMVHTSYCETTVTPTHVITATVTKCRTSVVSVPNTKTCTYTALETTTVTDTCAPVTHTITNTVTAVSTVTCETATTIAAPVNFEPIQDSLYSRRETRGGEEEKEEVAAGQLELRSTHAQPQCVLPNPQHLPHPKSVNCIKSVEYTSTETVTATGKTTKTKTAHAVTATSTCTSTTVITQSTNGAPYHATVTSTVTDTLTRGGEVVYQTSDTTTTVTTTNVVPTATSYAMCGADNYISEIHGEPIVSIQGVGFYSGTPTNATSAQDCCNQCAAIPQCAYSAYLQAADYTCYLLVFPPAAEDQCSYANEYDLFLEFSQSATIPLTVSNGKCGTFDSVVYSP